MKKTISVFLLACLILSTSVHGTDKLNPAEIMEQYGKAVVLIATVKNNEEVGLGSGFIVKNDGVIITNYHVIEGTYPALVKLKNGDIYEDISIIDYNERKDIAIIKVKGFDLPVVRLGNSNDVKVGEEIIIIGNPHGLENTISNGLLSQIRDTELGYRLHQISAPISAGSSGSPVFNSKGEVIGIATLSDVWGQNLNFSVPINYARGMIDSPIKYSLKEFSEIDKEKTVLGELKHKETIDNKEFLKQINNAIIALMSAYDMSIDGDMETGMPHRYEFKKDKFIISPKIYTANQLLKNAYIDLDEIVIADEELIKFKAKLLTSIKEAYEASNDVVKALEYETPNAFGVYFPVPEWTKAESAVNQIGMSFRKLDKDFIIKFVDRIKKENPSLEFSLLPYLVQTYEDRNKTEEEIFEENKKCGHIGIMPRFSTRLPVVLYLKKNGPAEKADIKKDDIILGIVGGPDFKTQMDYSIFQKTTKPSESYKFKIERKGKVLIKTIKMD